MNRKAQKMPEEFQEGSYTKHRGRTYNTGKSYKPTHSQSAPSQQPLPTLQVRQHGDQNDLGIEPMDLDPTLPTEEEVRGSYGKVFNLLLSLMSTHFGIEPE
jgi:hypothetical protein